MSVSATGFRMREVASEHIMGEAAVLVWAVLEMMLREGQQAHAEREY